MARHRDARGVRLGKVWDHRGRSSFPRAAADLNVAFGLTEPDAGTDTSRISTRAEPDGKGGYVLGGRKVWTSKALEAQVVLLLVRTGGERFQGLVLVLADLDPDYVKIRRSSR
ncbi:acyl-CoA dehydrogenase family protein [Pseudofrankia sp. BMG5.36]|uniref:acyl-CoA dehydrogenase family protein n=1 Tax=Pseudofrankia sp. BMG5.36 TaxID=1834512 RepID=UPI0008DAE9B3|nr:acyl-CoA dehydrogenase family protein [Pseudofrankia sp. BMG5.36]OHV43537.1 hypothetical protein BCD48_27545 [Pseudofrankia sp. BMG5.36]